MLTAIYEIYAIHLQYFECNSKYSYLYISKNILSEIHFTISKVNFW